MAAQKILTSASGGVPGTRYATDPSTGMSYSYSLGATPYTGIGSPYYGTGLTKPVAPVSNVQQVGYAGGWMNPYAGNIFAGLPTNIQQTPYGSLLNQAQRYNYTPAQLTQIANQQVGATIGSQLGASYANQNAEQAQFAAMQNRAAGIAQALGSFGPQYASAMQDAYNKAAQTMASVGPGVTGAGQQATQSALDQAKASAAAATGGQGQVSSYDPTQMAATLNTADVQIPGNSLALQGYNAAQMGEYGAMADKGQVAGVAQYYQQQAVNALQQRTAERAAIIANQPALQQQAYEQQRQDEAQTQDRIANIVSAGQGYISNLMGMRLQTVGAQNSYLMDLAKMTGVNPTTGQPMPGNVQITLKDGRTMVVPFADAAKAAYQGQVAGARMTTAGAAVESANASMIRANTAVQAAQNAGRKINTTASAVNGYETGTDGKPILDDTGNKIPYSPAPKQGTPLSTRDQITYQNKLGTFVQALKTNGNQPANVKTGAKAGTPYSIEQVIQTLASQGVFSNQTTAQWALNAIQGVYGVALTPGQIQMAMSGANLYGGSATAETPGGLPDPSAYYVNPTSSTSNLTPAQTKAAAAKNAAKQKKITKSVQGQMTHGGTTGADYGT